MTPDQAPLDAVSGRRAGRRRGRRWIAAAGVTIGAVLLAACTSGPGGTSPSGSGSASASPKQGGTLRLSMSDGSSSDTLDPAGILSTNSFVLVNSVFDQLTTFGPNFQAVPRLAASWEASSDAKKWTIKLQTGVKWQDGTDFSSKDVVYTMKRWLDPKAGGSMHGFMSPYLTADGVTAPDASTVVLDLKKPQGTLMQTFANLPYSSIVKDGATDFSGKNVVGTGPFKVSDFTPGQGWKLVRNDSYWAGAPYLDAIQGTVVPDQSAKVQAILAGSTDITDTIPSSLWPTLQGRDTANLVPIKNRNTWIYAFDQRNAPFNDPRVIQAIKLGTNRDQIVKTALQGAGTVVADVPVDPGSDWYPSGLKPDYDVTKAKSLLADAGYPNGFDMELAVTDSVAGMLDAAQAWQQSIKDIGINVKLNQLPGDTYYTKGWMATPAFMDYWTNAFPPVIQGAFYVTGAPYPEPRFTDPKVDSLYDQLLASTDPAQQKDLTQRAYLQARQTFGYLIPVFADAAYAKSPKVNGVIWTVAAFDFRKTWIS